MYCLLVLQDEDKNLSLYAEPSKRGPNKIQSLQVILRAIATPINTGVVLQCQQLKSIHISASTQNMLFYYRDQNANAWKNNYHLRQQNKVLLKALIAAYWFSPTSFLSFQTLQTSHITLLLFLRQHLIRPFDYAFLHLSWLSPQCPDHSRTDIHSTAFVPVTGYVRLRVWKERKKNHTFKLLHLITKKERLGVIG